MLFFRLIKIIKKVCDSLQVQRPNSNHVRNCDNKGIGRRVCLFTSKGSITIEAMLTTSVFLFAITFMISFLSVINTQLMMQIHMNNVAKATSKNMFYVQMAKEAATHNETLSNVIEKIKEKEENVDEDTLEKVNKVMDVAYLEAALINEIGTEAFSNSGIVGGILGLNATKSRISDGMVDLVVKYKLRIPFVNRTMTCMQRAKVKDWRGCDISKTEETVYITKNGTVYHKDIDCKYLRRNILKTSLDKLDNLRNDGGAKYKKCRYCSRQDTDVIYVTTDGTRYHTKLSCGALTRDIITVAISQVDNMKPCSNCGEGE